MPTVARSRFSTQTIGRESLIGRPGVAASDLTPDGEVEIDGATWRATSHREAGITKGDPVTVLGVAVLAQGPAGQIRGTLSSDSSRLEGPNRDILEPEWLTWIERLAAKTPQLR